MESMAGCVREDELQVGDAAVLRRDEAALGLEGLCDEGGLGVAGAEGAEGGEGADRALGELLGLDDGIDATAGLEVLLAETPLGDGLERAPEVEESLGVEGDAGGVAVAAEPREVLAALAERVDEVEALDAPGAPLPHAALDADDEGGLVEALDDAGGDDADDAGVPAFGPEDETAGTGTLLGLGDGLDEHPLLDPAAVGVGLVELRGERAGLVEARGPEQLEADGGVVEAAGGVDAGAEMEADLAGADGPFGLDVPATSLRARTPGRWAWASASRPWRTRMRFAPVRGTTSQMVASATRSMSGLSGGSRRVSNQPRVRSERRSAMTRLKATPAAQRALVGYSQPG